MQLFSIHTFLPRAPSSLHWLLCGKDSPVGIGKVKVTGDENFEIGVSGVDSDKSRCHDGDYEVVLWAATGFVDILEGVFFSGHF